VWNDRSGDPRRPERGIQPCLGTSHRRCGGLWCPGTLPSKL